MWLLIQRLIYLAMGLGTAASAKSCSDHAGGGIADTRAALTGSCP